MIEHLSISCDAPVFAELSAGILGRGKSLRFQARGSSMRPILRDGDILHVDPYKDRRIKIGDAVLCITQPGRTVIHRVIQKRKNGEETTFLLKGDNVSKPDGWFSSGQIFGRVLLVDRENFYIDMRKPIAKLLGWAVVFRYRMKARWGIFPLKYLSFLKQLPVLYRYFI